VEALDVPTKREQMNVQVSTEAKQMAKTCATAHQESLNTWVELAIRAKAAEDYEKFNLYEVNKALRKVAKKYLPGKVVTEDQMLALAQVIAADDTVDGFVVEHYTEPPPASKKKIKGPTRSSEDR
jgi:hypothetical protein